MGSTISEGKFKKVVRDFILFILRNLDYGIFIALFMVKVYIFAKYTGLVFVKPTMIMVSIGSALLLSFWILLLPRTYKLIFLMVLNVFITIVVISDVIYFRYFYDIITVPVLFQAGQASDLWDSIFNLFRIGDLLIFVDLLITIPLGIYIVYKVRNSKVRSKFTPRLVLSALAFVIGYIAFTTPVNHYVTQYGKNLFINNWSNVSVYNVVGLLGFHAHDSYKYLQDNVLNKKVITAAQEEFVEKWFQKHQELQKQKTDYFGVAKDKNVFIFQAEAFQNFVIGKSVNGQEITPNLNDLMKESMYFENFHHQVAQGRTSDAEFLSNVSLYPVSTGSVYIRFAGNEFNSLPMVLKNHDYTSIAFHSYEPSFWNRYAMYKNIGIDEFVSKEDFTPGEVVGWTLGDEGLLSQAIDKLVKVDGNFYAFVVGLSSHHPFTIAEKYKTLKLGSYEGTDFGNYLQSLHYVDYAIGQTIKKLKQEGLWNETVFVIYGDHDSGTLKSTEGMTELLGINEGELSYAQITREVPLFIHLPDNQGAGVYSQVGGQIDLTPTLMHFLGIEVNGEYFMGENLLNEKNRLTVFRDLSFTDGEVYYDSSLDGIFENGVCYDVNRNNKIDVKQCEKKYEQAMQQLEISDNVIFGNLIKK
ncbi:LTA synthase family protein [Bacillus suaedaesalsae]|uniref:LTA synthase family protein n=1 Tax=Bacillus suaedaesalsae TaxID=2810349 RepID=A0ABS2DKY0_9BACI|nr:LTA synthase family protein [Bacillus suaedaesalsae]MBM6619066.1 LTA synthase family protein [Bacillus suaedaesalsae]